VAHIPLCFTMSSSLVRHIFINEQRILQCLQRFDFSIGVARKSLWIGREADACFGWVYYIYILRVSCNTHIYNFYAFIILQWFFFYFKCCRDCFIKSFANKIVICLLEGIHCDINDHAGVLKIANIGQYLFILFVINNNKLYLLGIIRPIK
jgi:hypothetical protein